MLSTLVQEKNEKEINKKRKVLNKDFIKYTSKRDILFFIIFLAYLKLKR